MSDLASKLKRLSPQQRRVLERRLREKRGQPGQQPGETPGAGPEPRPAEPARPRHATPAAMDFSLFFFSADGTATEGDRYRLLLECARFADRHGFAAVWTPERHFQAFGGLYPNPSVLSAALAVITERVQIRAGSLVLPLHSPVRVAEDWALVDNLSRGRAAISFATGWHAHDYVIRPDCYEDRRERMFRDIRVVHRLWAGETVTLPGVGGEPTPVRTLPRPIQKELPFWVTATSPRTFREAGEIGANVLTALIGGTVEQLAEHVRDYRRARAENGRDPRTGVVSLMLHTYLDTDLEAARERVREPLKEYLKSFVDQFKPLAGYKAVGDAAENLDDLLELAFERYFDAFSLLGTPEKCAGLIEDLAAIGIDDAACLVDFGLDLETTMASLERLDGLRRRFLPQRDKEAEA